MWKNIYPLRSRMGKILEDGKTFHSHQLVFINIKKITILPKAIYRFNKISNKTPQHYSKMFKNSYNLHGITKTPDIPSKCWKKIILLEKLS